MRIVTIHGLRLQYDGAGPIENGAVDEAKGTIDLCNEAMAANSCCLGAQIFFDPAEIEVEQQELDEEPEPKAEKWTVILLYPDYASDNYGQETWLDTVTADSAEQAVTTAQQKCCSDNNGLGMQPEDLYPIAVIKGNHEDHAHEYLSTR